MLREGRQIFFSGNVQGVGFRWKTRSISSGFKVYGYVKNLSDGRVELYCEGDKKELVAFLQELKSEMRYNIKDEEIKITDFSGRYSSFSITV